MAVTFLFTLAAAIAFLPAGALLFLVLDRYAAPRVPKNLFDEKKVFLTFAVGIPLGIILGLIFLAYAESLCPCNNGDISAPSIYFLLFVLVAALLRRLLVRTKTFGGIQGGDPQLPVHVFSYGALSGATVGLALALEQFELFYPKGNAPALSEVLVLLGFATDMVLLEAWAGLRFGRAMRKGFSWLPPFSVLAGEALGLLALSPIFAGYTDVGDVTLVLLFVGASWALVKEEARALRMLRRAAGLSRGAKGPRFGRGPRAQVAAVAGTEEKRGTDAPPTEAATPTEEPAPAEETVPTGDESPSGTPPP